MNIGDIGFICPDFELPDGVTDIDKWIGDMEPTNSAIEVCVVGVASDGALLAVEVGGKDTDESITAWSKETNKAVEVLGVRRVYRGGVFETREAAIENWISRDLLFYEGQLSVCRELLREFKRRGIVAS